MLSIGKLAAGSGAGRYYVDQVADGREDYYSGEGEAPGRWIGSLSAQLGLSGQTASDEVLRLLAGQDPATGRPLGRVLKPGDVAGFDLTFRSPKSVSILFGIGDRALAEELRQGHDAAVAAALGFLEREACVVRRGAGGAVELPGRGFVAAAFEHRASRAGDPLLHTHVVVANASEGPDDRWTSLYSRLIYAHAKTAGYLYQAVLRDELTRRLGLDWEPVVNGTADVRGVPRSTIEHFSERRHEILEAMAGRGEHSARAAQIATLDTRRAKQLTLHDDQRGAWRDRATQHGFDLQRFKRVFGRATPDEPTPVASPPLAEELLGARGLTEHASSFTRLEVLQAMADAAPRGASVATLEARADQLLTDSRVVALQDGRFSTRELLDLERGLIDSARRRAGERAPGGTAEEIGLAFRARPKLAREQQELVARLVGLPAGVQVVLAPAGTGKTFALDAAREAWQRAGVPVIGCALSARAACELRDQAAIETTTIARLRIALDAGSELQPGSVLIVDEAGMVGTRDLAALADATERAQARLVLVGDDRQLSEIDAGGAFSALAKQVDAIELRQVRRQEQAWDRDALAQLRSGNVATFARAYADHGRVITRPSAAAARQALVTDWWQAGERGKQALMLAHRRTDVAELNAMARTLMRTAGRLGEDQLICGPRAFAVGDEVLATRNDRRLAVHNGLAAKVAAIDEQHLHLALGDGRRLALPVRYARAGHLDHAYALTAHRAQGATVDSTFVLGSDELYREWGYTAMSRHRHEARFYLSATPSFLNAPAPTLTDPNDVSSAVARALTVSRRQQLASATANEDPHEARRETARGAAAAADAKLQALKGELEETPVLRRRHRAELRGAIESADRDNAWEQMRLARFEQALGERSPTPRPQVLIRARDPLAVLDTPTHETTLPAPHRERPADDLTLDL